MGFARPARHRAEGLLHALGLQQYTTLPVSKISGGEKQRVAIARALMQEPELILADEPVSHLDIPLARQVLGWLKAEIRRRNATILCVLHDPKMVEEFADYTLSLERENPDGWRFRESDVGLRL